MGENSRIFSSRRPWSVAVCRQQPAAERLRVALASSIGRRPSVVFIIITSPRTRVRISERCRPDKDSSINDYRPSSTVFVRARRLGRLARTHDAITPSHRSPTVPSRFRAAVVANRLGKASPSVECRSTFRRPVPAADVHAKNTSVCRLPRGPFRTAGMTIIFSFALLCNIAPTRRVLVCNRMYSLFSKVLLDPSNVVFRSLTV